MFNDYIVTHDGRHHADELFAIALLEKYHFRRKVPVVRTRDNLISYTSNPNVYVVDVGTVFDKSVRNFDHHMATFTETWPDGTPKSACGLIFDHLVETGAIKNVDIEKMSIFIKSIDSADNGRELFIISTIISDITDFDTALEYARVTLDSVISDAAHRYRQRTEIESILDGVDLLNGYLIMPAGLGLSNFISEYLCVNTDIKLVITPRPNNEFSIQSVMGSIESPFSTRCPAPIKWRGLYDKDLVSISKIEGMVFCHKNGFLTVVRGDLKLAVGVAQIIIDNASTLYVPVQSQVY